MVKQRPTFSRIECEASEWLVAMSDRTVSLEQRLRFESWLNADAEHERIYQAQKTAWTAVKRMRQVFGDTVSELQPRERRLKATPFAMAASLALVAVGLFVGNGAALFNADESYATQVGQVKDIKLSDDTLVTLGASSRIDVDFSEHERRVVLTQGEAFFEVTRDTSRPFFVTAGATLVRVVGTKFDVHYSSRSVRVSVAEGRVEVMQAAGKAPVRATGEHQIHVLTAGNAALAESSGRVVATDTVDQEDLGAWRMGRLVYVDSRLRDVVDDINRYYDGRIELADEAIGDTQITTAFRVDQIDRMLEVLQGALPVRATQTSDGRIIISEKPAQQ